MGVGYVITLTSGHVLDVDQAVAMWVVPRGKIVIPSHFWAGFFCFKENFKKVNAEKGFDKD